MMFSSIVALSPGEKVATCIIHTMPSYSVVVRCIAVDTFHSAVYNTVSQIDSLKSNETAYAAQLIDLLVSRCLA